MKQHQNDLRHDPVWFKLALDSRRTQNCPNHFEGALWRSFGWQVSKKNLEVVRFDLVEYLRRILDCCAVGFGPNSERQH